MKKAFVITSFALLTLTGALLFSNPVSSKNTPVTEYTNDSTQVKMGGKSDSTNCAQPIHKCGDQSGCKKSGNSSCCQKK
jgi:hypothetical protein